MCHDKTPKALENHTDKILHLVDDNGKEVKIRLLPVPKELIFETCNKEG